MAEREGFVPDGRFHQQLMADFNPSNHQKRSKPEYQVQDKYTGFSATFSASDTDPGGALVHRNWNRSVHPFHVLDVANAGMPARVCRL